MLKAFGPDIAQDIDRIFTNIINGSETGKKQLRELREQAIQTMAEMKNDGTAVGSAQAAVYGGTKNTDGTANVQQALLEKTDELIGKHTQLSEIEEREAQFIIEQTNALGEQYVQLVQNTEEKEKALNNSITNGMQGMKGDDKASAQKAIQNAKNLQKEWKLVANVVDKYANAIKKANNGDSTKKITASLKQLKKAFDDTGHGSEKLRKYLDKLGDCGGDAEKLRDVFAQLEQEMEDLGAEAQEAFGEVEQAMQNAVDDPQAFANGIQNSMNQIGDSISQEVDQFARFGQQVQAGKDTIAGFKGEAASMGTAITSAGTAAMSAATAISMIANLSEGWNANATGAQKFATILMMVSALSMTYKSIREAQIAIDSIVNAQNEVGNAITLRAIAAEKLRHAGLILTATGKKILNKLTPLNIALTNAETAAVNANTAAWYSNPITAIIAVALLAVVAAVSMVTKAMQANTAANAENAKAVAQASHEKTESAKEEKEQMDELAQKYEELTKKYGDNTETLVDLQNETYKLLESYGLHDEAVKALTGDYDSLTQSIKDAQRAANDDAIAQAEKDMKNQQAAMEAAMVSIGGSTIDDGGTTIDLVGTNGTNSTGQNNLIQELEDLGIDVGDGSGHINLADFTEQAITNTDELRDILQKYQDYSNNSESDKDAAETANQLLGYLSDYSDFIDDYHESAQLLDDAKLDNIGLDNFTSGDIQSIEDYERISSAMAEEAQDQGFFDSEEAAEEWARNYLSAYEDVAEIIRADDIGDSLSDKIRGSRSEIDEFINEVQQDENGINILQGLQIDEGETLENVRHAYEAAREEAESQAIANKTSLLTTGLDELNKDHALSDETREALGDSIDWDKFDVSTLAEQMTMLQEATRGEVTQLNELYTTVDQRNKDMAEAEKANAQAIEETREKLVNLQAERDAFLNEDYTWWDPADNLKLGEYELQLVALRGELDTLMENDYTIDVDVNIEDTLLQQFQLEVDGICSQANLLQQAAEAIGEGWKVAAEDVALLADAFPEIYENAKILADGTVQLDQEVCNRVLANNGIILESDTETTAAQLENKIALLDAEIAYEQHKAQLLQDYLNGVIDESELEDGIKKAGAEFEQQLREAGLEDQANALAEAFKNQSNSTQSALDLLNQIDAKIQEVSENYSKMLSGDVVKAEIATVTGSGPALSSKYTETNIGELDNSKDTNYEQYKQQYEATLQKINELEQARGDYTELLSRLRSEADETKQALDGAIAGTGGKTDKDKGGSDKEKSEKELKNLDKEIERYAEIKELLDDIKREHDRLSKAKDRSWGAGRVKAINSEQAALQKQLGTLKQYKSQVQSFLNQDAAKAASFGASIVNGHISNFNDVIAGLTNDYNAAVTAYNGTAAGSDEEKAASKAIEDAEKRLSDAKEAMKQYEQTKDLMEDITDQITDTIFQIADLDLERITYIVELKLDLDDRQLRLIDDILEDLGDSADNALDSIEKMEDAIDTIFQSIIDNKDGVKELLDYVGVSGSDSAAFLNGTLSKSGADNIAEILQTMVDDDHPINYDEVVSKLEEYTDNLLDANEKLRQYRDQVFETLTNAMSEYLGDLNRISDKIAHITKLTQGYKDLITSIGKSNLDPTGALTQKINKTLQSEAESAYKSAKATQEYAQVAYNEALEGYQIAVDTGDEYAIRKWKEVLEQAEDDLNDAEEATLESMTALADAIATVFTESISQAVETMNHELGGLSVIREKFDQAKELSAQYLDDYKKIYELSKLNREVNASIDDTDNIRAKQLLMEYQQKIVEYQKDGVEMSQYEVDYLRAQYDLILARIAIEEAQKAKSQVSMVQDSEGNYSYVYTADDQAVADAEQNYEDKLYAMQVLNGEYINELQENLIAMQEEMGQKLEEIAENDALTYEEKKELIAETTEYYLERINFYSDQLGIAFDNNSQLYEKDWQEYHDKTGYKISANEDYIDSWEETSLAIITNVNSQQEYLRILETAIREARDTSREACDTATESLNNVGFTSQVLGNVIDQMTNQLENDARRASMSAEQMSREYQSAVTQIMNSVQAFTSTYCSQITAIIAQNQALIASMNAVIAAAAAMAAAVGAHSGGSGGGGGGYYGNPGSAGSPAKPTGSAPAANQNKGSGLTAEQIEGIAGNIWVYGSWGDNPTRQATMIDKFGQADGMAIYNAVQDKFNSGYGYSGGLEHDWDYYKKFSPSAFATGGYTGDWGSTEGKLALLHEKELVLNQYDTANMLQMIDMVRKIANTIDINALSSMGANLQAISSNIGNETEKLEQEVHITAEFPSVSDRNEILAAFDNVINLASQYANRK